ncbi:type IV pilin protein [Litoribrevibacter albus]|uniref:Prepilin-type N-terminal cleavage/methylation domain-containing protein n=1 Tax=Litoribrevibacter albus TaxID=1473156 RepID=A0AA37W9E0_9GAMM|nr:prepilin-type N-terminal cleavage/methylation domain-containing protein [Litoribrevibacter albus]GLQ33373.1 hypothetical protein GCM10007876_38530 [Litoribrevibacter albus]
MNKISKGFTIVELMITVAIIGIISAVAVPSYRQYIIDAETSVARQHLDQLELFLNAYHLNNNTFVSGTQVGKSGTFETQLGFKPGDGGDDFTYVVAACSGGSIADCYTAKVYKTADTSISASATKKI